MGKTRDPRGEHTRLYHDLQESPAWRALSFSDRGLYVELRRQLKSFNNGDISATMGGLKVAGVNSPTTLAKGLRALLATGFLAVVREGGIARGQKVCTLYRFTDAPCLNIPAKGIKPMQASNEWKQFKSVAQAEQAIEAVKAPTKSPVRKDARKNRSRIQKLERDDTDPVAPTRFIDTEAVVVGLSTDAETVAMKRGEKAVRAAPVLDLAAHH
jgi:hypothetical protein